AATGDGFEFFSAGEYPKPSPVAALRPMSPVRPGPCAPPLSPASALWHSRHCARKKVRPCIAGFGAAAPGPPGCAPMAGNAAMPSHAASARRLRDFIFPPEDIRNSARGYANPAAAAIGGRREGAKPSGGRQSLRIADLSVGRDDDGIGIIEAIDECDTGLRAE